MIYMLLPERPAGRGLGMAMPGMSGPTAANPAIALILAMFMLGYILWTADQIAARSRSAAAERAGRLTVASSGRPAAAAVHAAAAAAVSADSRPAISAPWLAACCKITMSIAMGYMLVGML